MKLTIKGDKYVNAEDKAGNPLIGKNGKPYKMIAFKVNEEVHGTQGEYIRGFYRDSMADWGDGTEIDVDVEKKESNGKVYLNFSLPKSESSSISREEFERRITEVFNHANSAHERIDEMTKERTFPTGEQLRSYADANIGEDNLPF